jgi:hypothetical protein
MYFTFDILAIRARTLRNCFSRSAVGFCNPSLSAGVMSIWLLDRMIWRSSNGSHESIGSKASLQRQRTGGTNRAGARAAGLSFATTVGRNSESVGTLQAIWDSTLYCWASTRARNCVFAGAVRGGFTPSLRREVHGKFKHVEIPSCPFDNLPDSGAGAGARELLKSDVRAKGLEPSRAGGLMSHRIRVHHVLDLGLPRSMHPSGRISKLSD